MAKQLLNSSERNKIYLALALSVVLAIVLYPRFFPKKSFEQKDTSVIKTLMPLITVPEITIPELPESLLSEVSKVTDKPKVSHTLSRDIFSPPLTVTTASIKEHKKIEPKEVAKPKRLPQLKGTIIGGDTSIAILDDQFVYKGGQIGDYQVVQIESDKVLLAADDEQTTLRVGPLLLPCPSSNPNLAEQRTK